jgi:hypothetical protein
MPLRPMGVGACYRCLAKEVDDAIAHPSPDPKDTDTESLRVGHIVCMEARPSGNLAYNECLCQFVPLR